MLKTNSKYKQGEVLYLSRNEAFGLIDSGVAKITKDMTAVDYKTKKK